MLRSLKTVFIVLLCIFFVMLYFNLYFNSSSFIPEITTIKVNNSIKEEKDIDVNPEIEEIQCNYEGIGEYPAKDLIPKNAKIIHPENLRKNNNFIIIHSESSYYPDKYTIAYHSSTEPSKTIILISFKEDSVWKEYGKIELINEDLVQMRLFESRYLILCSKSNNPFNVNRFRIYDILYTDESELKVEKTYDKIEFITMKNPYGDFAKEELISFWQRIDKEIYKVDLYKYDYYYTLKEAINFYPTYFRKVVNYYKEIENDYFGSLTYWEWLADVQVKANMPSEALNSVSKYKLLINKNISLPYHIQLIESQALLMLKKYDKAISMSNGIISKLENKLSTESSSYKSIKEKVSKNNNLLLILKESYRVLIDAIVELPEKRDVWDISMKQSNFLEDYFQDLHYYQNYPEYSLGKFYYQRAYCRQELLEFKRIISKWSIKEWNNALESIDLLSKEKDIYVKAKWVKSGEQRRLFDFFWEDSLLWIDSDFHILLWKEKGKLYSQEFIGYDDDHPFMISSALIEGRIIWNEKIPEMVLIYDNNTGGTGSGQVDLIIMQLIDHKWTIKWFSNANWRSNVYKVTFIGSGVDKVLVKSDSYAELDSIELPGLSHADNHIEYEDIWIKKGDQYILETSKIIPSEINTISEFVYAIKENDDEEALNWVVSKELLEYAKLNRFESACFCGYSDSEQNIENMEIWANEKIFIVSFIKRGEQYYISDIKEKEKLTH